MTRYNIDNLAHDTTNYQLLDKRGTPIPLIVKPPLKGLFVTQIDLPLEFIGRGEVRGFHFLQIAKSEFGYLFKVTIPEGPIHYEVFRRAENKRFGCVSYPSSNRFGLIAWTFRTFQEAVVRFNTMCIFRSIVTPHSGAR